jgi:hypothetical protein
VLAQVTAPCWHDRTVSPCAPAALPLEAIAIALTVTMARRTALALTVYSANDS